MYTVPNTTSINGAYLPSICRELYKKSTMNRPIPRANILVFKISAFAKKKRNIDTPPMAIDISAYMFFSCCLNFDLSAEVRYVKKAKINSHGKTSLEDSRECESPITMPTEIIQKRQMIKYQGEAVTGVSLKSERPKATPKRYVPAP